MIASFNCIVGFSRFRYELPETRERLTVRLYHKKRPGAPHPAAYRTARPAKTDGPEWISP
jgi:hypothetical protein